MSLGFARIPPNVPGCPRTHRTLAAQTDRAEEGREAVRSPSVGSDSALWVRVATDLAALLAAASAGVALWHRKVTTSTDETARVIFNRMSRLQRLGLWLAAVAGVLALLAAVVDIGSLIR